MIERGLVTAQAYVDMTPLTPNVLPGELVDPDRREIDRIIAKRLGIPASNVEPYFCEMYVELTAFQRKSRLLELQAQVNRRGTATAGSVTPGSLADEILGELIEEGFAIKEVPAGFFSDGTPLETVSLAMAGKFGIAFGRWGQCHSQQKRSATWRYSWFNIGLAAT